MYFNSTFHLIKDRNMYLGFKKPGYDVTLFLFKKRKHAKAVKQSLDIFDYDIQYWQDDTFKMNVVSPNLQSHKQRLSIEPVGYFDAQIHTKLNNLKMFVIDDVIEDDEVNIYLLNRDDVVIDFEIDKEMITQHLTNLYNLK